MTRPTLLFLSHTIPYPPDGGADIRAYHLLRLLAVHYEVTALCYWRPGDSAEAAFDRLTALNEIKGVSAIGFPRAKGAVLMKHLRSLITGRFYTAFTLQSIAYRRELKRLLRDRAFDMIHLDTLDLVSVVDLLPPHRVVCGHHNVESLLLRRRAEAEKSFWRRVYIRRQARLMELEERRWCPTFALNVAVSDSDARELARVAPGSRTTVVPNGVDTRTFTPETSRGEGLVFVGGTGWFPNRDALTYFAHEILPLIRAREEVRTTWIGHADTDARRLAEHAGITMTGFIDDIRPHVRRAACFVVPLRLGGGTRLKILDAWAMGKPVVSTSAGCEGLKARDGWNILIRDDPREFAAAVHAVLGDDELRARLGANARSTAERTYSWDVIGEAIYRDYESVRRDVAAYAAKPARV